MELKEDAGVELSPYDVYVMGWAVNAALHMMKMGNLGTGEEAQKQQCMDVLVKVAKKLNKVLPDDIDIMQFPLQPGGYK